MRFIHIMLIVFGLLLTSIITGVWIDYASGMPGLDTSTISIRCQFEMVIVNVRQGDQWDTRYITDKDALEQLTQAFHALHGPNTWIGYDRNGWDIPGYAERQGVWESEITMYGCGRDYILWSWKADTAPNERYLFIFNSMKENCDKQDNHCGNHDFAYDGNQPLTFRVDFRSIAALYSITD